MRTEIPVYHSDIFPFKHMFTLVMEDFVSKVSLGMIMCQHMSLAQKTLINTATHAMGKAVKIVTHGNDPIVGMAMLAEQADCQQGIEDGCRYPFHMHEAMIVAHHEMYLYYLKIAVEIVDIVTAWENQKNDKTSKRHLGEATQLMAQCWVLYYFAHVQNEHITHGTMLQIMPLIRFQPAGRYDLDKALEEEKKHAESRYVTNERALQEARTLYMHHHSLWMDPLKAKLDLYYIAEVARCN